MVEGDPKRTRPPEAGRGVKMGGLQQVGSGISGFNPMEGKIPAIPVSIQLLRDKIGSMLDVLSSEEKRVVELRFGLEDGKTWPKTAIARDLGKSPRTIGRREESALEKLRHSPESTRLREYFGFFK